MRTPEPRPYLMGDTVADRAQYATDLAEWADRPQEYPTVPWTRAMRAAEVARRMIDIAREYPYSQRHPVVELTAQYGRQAVLDALPVLREMAAQEHAMEVAFRVARERINWIIQEVGQ
jgi:hypothetical protein